MLTLTEHSPRLNLPRLSLLRAVEDIRWNCAQVSIDSRGFANDVPEKAAMLADNWLAESIDEDDHDLTVPLTNRTRKNQRRECRRCAPARARHVLSQKKSTMQSARESAKPTCPAYIESARHFELNILYCREFSTIPEFRRLVSMAA